MNAKIRITYRDQNGDIIENPVAGQKAYSPETNKLYMYTGEEWKLIEGDVDLGMTTYDINKQIIGQLGVLDEEGMSRAQNTLTAFVEETKQTYYMLLCRDINYYTIFYVYGGLVVPMGLNKFCDDVLDCAQDVGAIKSVESTDGAIEIWVHPVYGDPVAMYLFPYDMGVVECIL